MVSVTTSFGPRVSERDLQVRPGASSRFAVRTALAGRQLTAHLLELLASLHLLREQRGLDAVEQPREPADELGLRDPQLGLTGDGVARERGRQAVQLVLEVGR